MRRVIPLLLLSILLLSGCSENGGLTKQASKASSTSVEPMGSTISFDKIDFTPTKAVKTKQFGGKTSDGEYIILTVTAKNGGSKAITVTNDQFFLVDGQKREYKSSNLEFLAELDQEFHLTESINPGLSKTGEIVFEVPDDADGLMVAVRSDIYDFGGADYKFVELEYSE